MKIVRRDGTTEDFIREKIVVAVIRAGGRLEMARGIAQDVESALASSKKVTTDQVRTEVQNRLKAKDAAVYKSWMSYDKDNRT